VLAVSVVLLILLIMFFESRDDSEVDRSGLPTLARTSA
jgi:hypothetical protein